MSETVVQETAPPQMPGRVLGAAAAIDGWDPVGTVVTGLAVQGLGVIPTVAGMGVI